MPLPVPSSSYLLWLLKLKLTLNSTAKHLINSNSSMLLILNKDMDILSKLLKDMDILSNILSKAIMPHLSINPTLKAIRLLTKLNNNLTADTNLKLLLALSGKLGLLSDPAMLLLSIRLPSIPTGSIKVNQTKKLSPPAHLTSLVTLTLKAASSLSRSLTT